jgi:outer membrane autotransporter protein
LRSQVGAHAAISLKVGNATVRPEVHAAWQHEYGDRARSISSEFINTGAVFGVRGPSLGRDSAIVGAGVSVEVSPTFSIYAGYEGEVGRTNYIQHTASASLRVAF